MLKYSLVFLFLSVSTYACPELQGMYSGCDSKDPLAASLSMESVKIQQKKLSTYTVVKVEEVSKSDHKKSSLTIATNGKRVTKTISSSLGKMKAVLQAKCSIEKNGVHYLNIHSSARLPGSDETVKELSRFSRNKTGSLVVEKFADFGDGEWISMYEEPIFCRRLN